MRVAYLILSLGIIALGAVHIGATPRLFTHLTSAAVWFACGGLAIIMVGALNLLRRAYGEIAPGIRWVCVVANVVMTSFALVAGYAGGASALQFSLIIGLMGGATLLSLFPATQRPSRTTAPAAPTSR